MSLTRLLTRLIRVKPVNESDFVRAAQFVLDAIACALGARGTEPARILTQISPLGGDLRGRAFTLGGMAHILEIDDLHRASVTHPGCVVIPAAWAVAEARDLGGRAFLKSVLAGYEAMTRIGMAVGPAHYRVWHNTATCGPFGSAMASADLMDLDEDQTVWALGNAGTQASGLWEFLSSGAMSKHLHTARAAESGVLAALLAGQGFTGADTILEGEKGFFKALCPDPRPSALLADPEAPWQLTQTSIKPWPCCRHTHPAIDAALELYELLRGAPVIGVDVATYRAALDVCDRPQPADPYSAKFSLQHCVAAALLDGRIDQASFGAEGRAAASALWPKVALRVAPAIESAYPAAWGADITIETADGRKLAARRKHCKGDPEAPVSDSDLAAKARMLLGEGGMRQEHAERLIDAVGNLTHDAPVRSLPLFA